jgi:hypothetical protein
MIVMTVMIGFWWAFNLLTLTNVIYSLLNVLNWIVLLMKALFTQNGLVQQKEKFPSLIFGSFGNHNNKSSSSNFFKCFSSSL